MENPAPLAERIEIWLGILGSIAGFAAWCLARARSWIRIRRARWRYSLAAADAVRMLMLNAYGVGEERPSYEKIQEGAAISLHELQSARRALWRAEGRPDPSEDQEGADAARELLRELRRARQTQEFKAPQRQDVFTEDDRE